MAKLIINEDIPASEMPALLEELSRQIEEGNTSGYYPTWELVATEADAEREAAERAEANAEEEARRELPLKPGEEFYYRDMRHNPNEGRVIGLVAGGYEVRVTNSQGQRELRYENHKTIGRL